MRERGLKLNEINRGDQTLKVAPHAGAWIETGTGKTTLSSSQGVAPHAGAWIETDKGQR